MDEEESVLHLHIWKEQARLQLLFKEETLQHFACKLGICPKLIL